MELWIGRSVTAERTHIRIHGTVAQGFHSLNIVIINAIACTKRTLSEIYGTKAVMNRKRVRKSIRNLMLSNPSLRHSRSKSCVTTN